jgi:hypothetical protein
MKNFKVQIVFQQADGASRDVQYDLSFLLKIVVYIV